MTATKKKRSGWDCAWATCDKTALDEPLFRTEPKGKAGIWMCAQHVEQKRIERSRK